MRGIRSNGAAENRASAWRYGEPTQNTLKNSIRCYSIALSSDHVDPQGVQLDSGQATGAGTLPRRPMNVLHLVQKQATKQQALQQAQILLARKQRGAA